MCITSTIVRLDESKCFWLWKGAKMCLPMLNIFGKSAESWGFLLKCLRQNGAGSRCTGNCYETWRVSHSRNNDEWMYHVTSLKGHAKMGLAVYEWMTFFEPELSLAISVINSSRSCIDCVRVFGWATGLRKMFARSCALSTLRFSMQQRPRYHSSVSDMHKTCTHSSEAAQYTLRLCFQYSASLIAKLLWVLKGWG